MHALRAGRGAHCPSVFVCVAHLSLEMTALFILLAYFGSWAGALKPVRVVSAPRAAPMPGSAPGISGAESGLAPGPPPEADGDMHRDPFRLLEAALGRSNGASQRLGRASFTHAATTGMRGPSVESWYELHVRGGCGHSRPTRRASKLAVGVLSWGEPETAAEEPSAVASQRLPGSPSGGSCPF